MENKECTQYERGLNHISLSAVCLVSRRGHRTCSLWAWSSTSFSRKENIRMRTKTHVKQVYRTGYQGEYVTKTGYRTGLLIKQKITSSYFVLICSYTTNQYALPIVLEAMYVGVIIVANILCFSAYYTRTGEGGRFCPQPVFFANNLKTVERSAAKFVIHLRTIQDHTFCANFDFLGQKVRSPGQVKVRCAPRNRLQTSTSRCGHSCCPKDFKL